MAVTVGQATSPARGIWDLNFSSDLGGTPTFYIYRDAELVNTTTLTRYQVTIAAGESPVFAIFDDAADRPDSFSSRAHIQWLYQADIDYYRVEEFISAAWVERKRLTSKVTKQIYDFNSRVLEDVTTHQFRVTAVGVNGNESTASSITLFMIRTPDPPDVTYSYTNGTKLITVAAS